MDKLLTERLEEAVAVSIAEYRRRHPRLGRLLDYAELYDVVVQSIQDDPDAAAALAKAAGVKDTRHALAQLVRLVSAKLPLALTVLGW